MKQSQRMSRLPVLAIPLARTGTEPDSGLAAILSAILEQFLVLVLPSLFEFFPAPWLLVCTGALGRIIAGQKAGRYTWVVTLSAGLFCAVFLWAAREENNPVPLAVGVVLMALLIAALLCINCHWQTLWPRLALLAGVFLLAAPFAAISDTGPRCCNALRLQLTQAVVEQNRKTVVLPTMVRRCYYVWGLNPQSAGRA